MRFLTSGESHGKGLLSILEGLPAGLAVDEKKINSELRRRQLGIGRGPRMNMEKDSVQIISGVKKGLTLGSPIGIFINNKDASIDKLAAIFSPRPGHADLSGALKYGFKDIRNVLERASARETAARVAVGAICKIFLEVFHVGIESNTLDIGGKQDFEGMAHQVDAARNNNDTLGGIFEVTIDGLPAGLGSYVQWDRRLDGRLAQAIVSIPGIKSIEFGLGAAYAQYFGSEVHDAIFYKKGKGYYRKTNNAGGLEGGMTNGECVVLRACMKPIATLAQPLDSVNILNKRSAKASVQRADISAVEAAGVVAENMAAYILTDAFLEKFGQDSMAEIKANYLNYKKKIC
ncbi:MAG: chorismate synthase [Candidatus Omnitrophica bacterium]|nr:chorismate synthase [Candidatus Omnitrophota bacterium]MDD5236882.1 chorismate synthase [Candidatus Omnitrophota bacterium]MDD5610921.1 chorismate synthase [Candidatus Omnitrophota bacterium]